MKQYLDLCKKVVEQGTWKPNRTSIDHLSYHGDMCQYDLREGFPTKEIWYHYEGYESARQRVIEQSTAEDLGLIDALFGQDNLNFRDGAQQIKNEALRQMEIEWRSDRNETAEFWLAVTLLKQY